MRDSTLLPGVSQHGDGYRVRVMWGKAGKGGRRILEQHPTAAAANARVLELQAMRAQGLKPWAVVPKGTAEQTLRAACETLLTRKRATVSRKTKRQLRASGVEWWERVTKPWRTGEFAEVPLSALRRDSLEDLILTRALKAPKTAGDELYGLKAALRYASQRGGDFDQAILAIEPIVRETRQRHALSAAELEYLAGHAPEYARRMLLFKGTVGNRIGELFTLSDARIDLKAGTIFIPAGLCKEAVDKTIDLTGEERTLLREQLVARAPGTALVFPTKTGKPWRYGEFHKMVWKKAVTRASAAWREEHGLFDGASTPFEWQLADDKGEPRFNDTGAPLLDRLEPHDLRATAATLMRDAGFTKEQAAARLGHADSGQLLDRIYDLGDRRERARVREAINELAPDGLRATLHR